MAGHVDAAVEAAHPLTVHRAPGAGAVRRRNLVFFRCGSRSTHYRHFPLPGERSWDCALSFYEPHQPQDLEHAEYVLGGSLSKWHAFAQARFGHPALGFDQYDAFLLVDDDVEFADAADFDRMFALAREHGLAVCQPALSPQSHGFWDVTFQHRSWVVRLTNFVECMTPLLSADAVNSLREELQVAVSGCGLDLVIHHVLGPDSRMGIVDAVTVTHAKPQDVVNGPFYRFLDSVGVNPARETLWFLQRHGLAGVEITTFGGVAAIQPFYPVLLEPPA